MIELASKDLQKLSEAAFQLEQTDLEYTLETLVQKSRLQKDTVVTLLRNYWVSRDFLNIVYLELTPEEEKRIFQ